MNVGEMAIVCESPFKLPRMATKIEDYIGRLMLKAERDDGHVARTQTSKEKRPLRWPNF